MWQAGDSRFLENAVVQRIAIFAEAKTSECVQGYGTSLEYSFHGGRTWGIMSFHVTVAEALDAFAGLGLGKDRDPLHYRILKES